jgi:hypothetical protein
MKVKFLLCLLILILMKNGVFGQSNEDLNEKIKNIEERIEILINEINKLKKEQKDMEKKSEEVEVIKDEFRKLKLEVAIPKIEYKSYSGLGPSASKVYFIPRGLSIGGYGEINYEGYINSNRISKGDVLRFVPYFGYKFSDNLLLNVELEIEHAGIKNIKPKEPESYVEFAYIDFLLNNKLNLRSGLILLPVSRMNEYHEPTVYYGVLRPDVERYIIPTVWRELGLMAYGEIMPNFTYKTAITNGLRTDTITDWIDKGRQKGATINANNIATTLRFDYATGNGLNLGASFYYGTGSDRAGGEEKGNQEAKFGSRINIVSKIKLF